MAAAKDTSKQQPGAEQSYKDKWVDEIMNAASSTSAQSETTLMPRIQKIPPMLLRDTKDFEKYYVPRVVALGPYHHGNEKLVFIENLKPKITNNFVENSRVTLGDLYDKLYCKIKEVRNCYEDNSTGSFSDDELTTMMLQDGCFILHCIDHSTGDKKHDMGLKSHHIAFIQQDLFLLENQVPYMVLEELMKPRKEYWQIAVDRFINNNTMTPERVPKVKCNMNAYSDCCVKGSRERKDDKGKSEEGKHAHLLAHLQMRLVGKVPPAETNNCSRYTFRNVNELLTVGIHFRPCKSGRLTDINYRPSGFFANLELPPITIDDSTKPILLNLVAYEMCANVPNESWVTSYICFLDSLIDHAEDVKELRKAGVLDNSLGSDEEVAKLFNEIGTDLVPNPSAYAEAKSKIQKHYENKGKTWVTQLEHEYFKNPWSLIALFGAVVALFLSGVQAYFSVWSTPGECDGVCKYIKHNHHL